MTSDNVLYKYRQDIQNKLDYTKTHPELYDNAEEKIEALEKRLQAVTQAIEEGQ